MKVWVVVSDCGLNGPAIHGVYTSPPDPAEVARFVDTYRVSGTTGYQNTRVETFEVDAPFVLSGGTGAFRVCRCCEIGRWFDDPVQQ